MKNLLFTLFLSFTFTATLLVPEEYPSIQSAIDASSDGDTILVNDGIYNEGTINILNKYVNIISINGPESTVISGQNSNRVLYIENNEEEEMIFEGFTLSDGRPGSDDHASALKVETGLVEFKNLIIEDNGGGTGNTVAMGSGIDKTYFIDTIVRNNSVENYGGLRASTNIRCVLYGNNGWNNTSVLLNGESFNCVVYNNGGGYSSGLAGGSASNCIFWNNSSGAGWNAESITYSNIENGYDGEGNIASNPLFIDPYNGNFNLQLNSPCIDKGDPNSELDPDGTRADMGAFYFHQGLEELEGCTNTAACNYDSDATVDDGSCIYFDCGGECGGDAIIDDCGVCNSPEYVNEDKDCNDECFGDAYIDDCGICDDDSENDNFSCSGCTDVFALNYNPDAEISDLESCIYPENGCYVPGQYESIPFGGSGCGVVYVSPGTYYVGGAETSSSKTFVSYYQYSGDESYIDSTILDFGNQEIELTGSSGRTIRFDGFTMKGGSSYYGAIDNQGHYLYIDNCKFIDGPKAIRNSAVKISNTSFMNRYSSSPIIDRVDTLINSTFYNNSCSKSLLEMSGQNNFIENVVFAYNTVTYTDTQNQNCLIEVENHNNIINKGNFVNNQATVFCLDGFSSDILVLNSILYNNNNNAFVEGGSLYFSHSNVDGVYEKFTQTQGGNVNFSETIIDVNPLFLDSNYIDLNIESDCIDSGIDEYYYSGNNFLINDFEGFAPDIGYAETSQPYIPNPTILNIEDVDSDQGGKIFLDFQRSFYDKTGLRNESYQVEVFDDSQWVGVATQNAYNASTYRVLVTTLTDSSSTSDGLYQYRVIANMDEGNFVSDLASGYSIDNLSPDVPDGLQASLNNGEVELLWNESQDFDFDYYEVYKNNELLDYTIENSYIDNNTNPGIVEYYIVAYDENGNFSNPSNIISVLIENPILGCTDVLACNYNADANTDDGSCDYSCQDNGNFALNFDGDNDYVKVLPSEILSVSNEVTYAAWFKHTFDENHGIGNVFRHGWFDGNWFRIEYDDNKLYFNLYGSPSQVVSNTSLEYDKWYLVVGTYDGENIDLYIDGSLDATRSSSGTIQSTSDKNLVIGGALDDNNNPNELWDGSVGSFAIWDRALSENEIQSISINQGSININSDENLIANWTFNEGEGDIIVDYSGNQNHGTIYGAEWVEYNGGCTDPMADNYNSEASFDDGSCNGSIINYEDFTYSGELNGNYYYLSNNLMNWHDAVTISEESNGHLVTITSEEENNFVSAVSNYENIYIGLTDQNQEGVWEWITGEPFSFSNWVDGEPNDGNSDLAVEDWVHTNYSGNGDWNDDWGDSDFFAVLEIASGCTDQLACNYQSYANNDDGSCQYNSGTWYVSVDGDNGNCGSETAPLNSVQSAIDLSNDGDTILVSGGIYYENINFNGKNISVIGEDRETTIIDGGGGGTVVEIANYVYNNAFLSGFTLQNGKRAAGAGIFIQGNGNDVNVELQDLIIINNEADFGDPGNNGGGGLHLYSASAIIDNVIFEDNYTNGVGGAIWVFDNSVLEINNSTISNNLAQSYGGGIYIDNANVNIINSDLYKNYAENTGGAINVYQSELNIVNSGIFENYSNYKTPGIFSQDAILNINKTTFARNGTNGNYDNTGVLAIYNSNIYLKNSIIFHNDNDIIPIFSDNSVLDVTFSNINANYEGVGNISLLPEFVLLGDSGIFDEAIGDYNLKSISPCIDTGDPNSELDPDGTRADMGAYYYDQIENPILNVEVISPNGGEVWQMGESYDITWDANLSNTGIFLHKNEEMVLQINGDVYTDTNFLWTIPTDLEPGNDYKIRIKNAAGPEFDFSDNNFSIILPNILGCTNPFASNYNDIATLDDGSCVGGPVNNNDFSYVGNFQNSHYYQLNNFMNWRDSKEIAILNSSTLVSLQSESENNYVESLLTENTWTDLSQLETISIWKNAFQDTIWIGDGNGYNPNGFYTNWFTDVDPDQYPEPNGIGGNSDINCVSISASTGKWDDYDCNWNEMYTIIELVPGCTNFNACNYDKYATYNDGSCIYPEESFDCEGNCTAELDCLGECGGDAIVDECGVCGGPGKIECFDASFECTEDECLFVQLIYPNGGENLVIGETYKIEWIGGFTHTGLNLSKNGIDTGPPTDINGDVDGSLGEYYWTVPNDIEPGSDYQVRIYDATAYEPEPMDYSDNFFSIGSYDCEGIFNGTAVIDDCGICNGANADIDDCGVCFGENQDQDCNGDCFGTAVIDECGVCEGPGYNFEGNLNNDCFTNIQDILILVNAIVNLQDLDNGDLNGDEVINIIDVVYLINLVFNDIARLTDATNATLLVSDYSLALSSNGYVGGIQMTLNHGEGFEIELTENSLISDYLTKDNATTLVVLEPLDNVIFTTSSTYEIMDMMIVNSQNEIEVNLSSEFSLGHSYPNPFNPSTTISLTVPITTNVSVKVYNLMGQVVDVLSSGVLEPNVYSFTWNASDMSSGIYIIKAESSQGFDVQKVLLVK